ncbi:MAG: hypothetical protein KDB00_19035 [Planctomycetales bacterium]|nr:hypothetical protein [Planctomycetales bacterium]
MQLDPLYVTEPQESVNQLRAIKTWKQFVEQPGLTKGQQVFAWWRIGSLAAYNFDVDRGESADVTLAAKAFQRVHAIGGDLISRETLNTATVYGTLGGEPADRALRLAESYRWLFTRTDQMIAASVPEINHNGHCIDDASMPGGMKLDTAAKKRGFLATELARSRQALTGRITDEIKYSRDPTAVKTLLDSIREIADDKQVQQWAALAAMVVADDLDRRGVHDNSLAQASLARGTADDSPRAAIQFSGFPELATDEQVGKSWGIAKLIARYSWAGDDCKLMAAEFLEAWTKTREEVPDYIRDDLDRYVARRVYQLQKNLDNDQYLTAEMKDAVVTLNYFNNARSLLRLADHQWPDEKVWRGNLDAYDQLMKDLCRRLETKGDIIPVWASESLVTTAAGIFDGFRLEFFHPRGHHILSEVDRKRLVAILDEQVASTESLFAKQQTGASGKKSESPNVPGNTKILEPIGNSLYHVIHNYLDSVALEGIQENGLSREFTARHESMMNALSTRFTALHQTEWKARQDWVTDRLVDTEREAFLELPFEPLPKRARRLDSLAVMAPPQVTSAKGSSRTSAATTIDKAVARLLTAAGQPTWTLRSVDQQPTVIVDGFVGYRITLRRTWKEYTSPPQQKAEFNEDTGPFEMKHEDWEFVLIPADPKPVATNLASKIPWQKSNSPFFTRDVCMGEGQGFVWYTRGTLFGQEFVREKLKLTGGEDRIGLLIDGIQVEDTNTMTANSCQSAVAHFGDAAVVAIENAVANSNDPNATLKLIASLRYIQTDKSTQLMLNLYRSAQDDVRTAAAYALVHQPFRPAAKEAYFDMLRRHQRVYESCRACRQFHWKDALPLMNDLIDRPANLRELSFTIPTRRTLQGNPIPQVLLDAQEAIRSAGDNIDAEVERQLQILVDSDDSEAARLIAIELATYVRKGSSRRTNEIGIQILKLRPRQPTIEYLQGLVEVLPPNDRQEVEKLIQQVTKH